LSKRNDNKYYLIEIMEAISRLQKENAYIIAHHILKGNLGPENYDWEKEF